MNPPKVLAIACAAAFALAGPVNAFAQQSTAVSVDADATAAAKRMRAYLHSLPSFEVRADATMEEALDSDLKVQLTNRVRYEYRAPDRLFAEWQSDRQLRRLYYDGRTLTLVAPVVGFYASVPASGSVADVLQRISKDFGIEFPLPDLFLWAWTTEPAQGVTKAISVGPARIVQVDTDHYLYREKDVDWQMWVERGARPLPRKIVITDRSDTSQPSYSALLQWNPGAQFPDDHFVFNPPPDAKKIDLAKADTKGRR